MPVANKDFIVHFALHFFTADFPYLYHLAVFCFCFYSNIKTFKAELCNFLHNLESPLVYGIMEQLYLVI